MEWCTPDVFLQEDVFFFSILNSKNWWQFPLTGLFLRTLEHIQLTVYATLSHEGLLYAGGSNKAIVYYDFAVSVSAFPLLIFGKEANWHQGNGNCLKLVYDSFGRPLGQYSQKIIDWNFSLTPPPPKKNLRDFLPLTPCKNICDTSFMSMSHA